MKSRILMAGVALMVVFSACKTTKTVSSTPVPVKQEKPDGLTALLGNVKANQPQFTTANVNKMSMELALGDRTVNVSASARIRKDSAIYVSFQVFGLEVFKTEMTTDSMRVFDKMGRRYYVADYGFLSRQFGVNVDFYSLQSLLTAQFFCAGQAVPSTEGCSLNDSGQGTSEILYHNDKLEQTTRISAQKMISAVLLKAAEKNYTMETTYSDYAAVSGVNFPKEISILAGNDQTKISCKISILKAEFNTPLKFQPLATDKYTRGDINHMLKKF